MKTQSVILPAAYPSKGRDSKQKCFLNGCYDEKEIAIFHSTAVIEFEIRGGTHSVTYPSPSKLVAMVYS